MGKSFADYQAEHLHEAFPLPMPDGTTIPLPMASIDEEAAVERAIDAAREAGEWTRFTGLEVIVSAADAARIAEAWGKLPPEAWTSVMTDMRKHFGRGNSAASQSS